MTATTDLIRSLVLARAGDRGVAIGDDGQNLNLPGGETISTDRHFATITAAGRTDRFSTQDSIDLALLVVRMDEALAKADGTPAGMHKERLRAALWSVEVTLSPIIARRDWHRLKTTAGMVAAAWDVGMVRPRAPAINRVALRLDAIPALDRLRQGGALSVYMDIQGRPVMVGARRKNGQTGIWTACGHEDTFLDAALSLP